MHVDKLCICGLKFVELLVNKGLIIIIIVVKKEVAAVM